MRHGDIKWFLQDDRSGVSLNPFKSDIKLSLALLFVSVSELSFFSLDTPGKHPATQVKACNHRGGKYKSGNCKSSANTTHVTCGHNDTLDFGPCSSLLCLPASNAAPGLCVEVILL